MSVVELSAPAGRQAVARGSTETFDDLFRTYAPRVKALAERRLPGRHVADDVVQETFLRAYRSFGAIDPDRPVWPWLRTVATNVCVDIVRQRRHADRDSALGDSIDTFVPVDAKNDPGEIHLAGQRRSSIAAALADVNPRQRRVVVLKDIEGWETEEVAQLEGITVDAVKSTLKRGRHAFRASYLALANRNGLLGGFGLVGLVGRVRRAALRVRGTGKAGGAALPALPLLPLAVVLTIAGGVAGWTHLPTNAGAEEVGRADDLVARSANLTGGAIGRVEQVPAAPAAGSKTSAGARTIAPLGDGGDLALAAAVDRDAERMLIDVTVGVDVKVAGHGLDRPTGATVRTECGDDGVKDFACDTGDSAWASASPEEDD